MPRYAGYFTGVLAGAVYLAGGLSFSAIAQNTPPDFAPNPSVGWYSYSRDFIPPASGPGPVVSDPAHPHISNDDFRVTGQQPTQAVADLNNPILQPWARELMRKRNELVFSGKLARSASCRPGSVTSFINSPMTNPMYFLQTPTVVVMIRTSNNDFRHIYLTDKHSENVKTSWYGESIGHYEGDTLVIDTIGLSDRMVLDVYRTPHTEKLHVVERWKVVDGGKMLEATFTVEDPDAFYQPWSGMRRYRRAEREDSEMICAENNQHLFDYHIPTADKPDF